MRVLLGLAALAAVNAQSITISGQNTNAIANVPGLGQTALSKITVTQTTATGTQATISPVGSLINTGSYVTSNNYGITVPNSVTTIVFTFVTNAVTAQMQYRWNPGYAPQNQYPGQGYSAQTYTCDPCAGGTPSSCVTGNGPANGSVGYACSNLTRVYTFSGLVAGVAAVTGAGLNSFSVQQFDLQTNPGPDTSSYSFIITRAAPTVIVGDPQIVGMQGQDFQVHGVPDEIFNIVTYPTLQINARFTYLESGVCHDNFTACFAHPGTYISEEGIRIGKDKVRVSAGSFKKGLTVHVNGKKIKSNTDLKNGAIEMVSHRRVVVHTDVMRVAISNSDNFMNQELELMDDKLVSLGAKRVTLKDNQKFHSEVPLHGLQGQTWRNVEYPSGLEYEGSIMDYHVVDGNLFGTDFVFNQFQS